MKVKAHKVKKKDMKTDRQINISFLDPNDIEMTSSAVRDFSNNKRKSMKIRSSVQMLRVDSIKKKNELYMYNLLHWKSLKN